MNELDDNKRRALEEFRWLLPSSTFIETGTASATTTKVAADLFDHVFTIDLNEDFYQMAALETFFYNTYVTPLYGDSAKVLKWLLYKLDKPCVILLDAHYVGDGVKGESGDTPVREELEALREDHNRHIILIDDARLFGFDPAYPEKWELLAFANEKNMHLTIEDDIVRMIPYELIDRN